MAVSRRSRAFCCEDARVVPHRQTKHLVILLLLILFAHSAASARVQKATTPIKVSPKSSLPTVPEQKSVKKYYYSLHPVNNERVDVSTRELRASRGACWVDIRADGAQAALSPGSHASGDAGGHGSRSTVFGESLRPCSREERERRVPVLRSVLEDELGFSYYPSGLGSLGGGSGLRSTAGGNDNGNSDNKVNDKETAAAKSISRLEKDPEEENDAVFLDDHAENDGRGAPLSLDPVSGSHSDSDSPLDSDSGDVRRRAELAAKVRALLGDRHLQGGAASFFGSHETGHIDSDGDDAHSDMQLPLHCIDLHWIQVSLPAIGAGDDVAPGVVSGVDLLPPVGDHHTRCSCGDSVSVAAAASSSSSSSDPDETIIDSGGPLQRVFINRIPGAVEMNRKDTFALALRRMQRLHGREHFAFHPETWLPSDPSDRRQLLEFARGDASAGWSAWIQKDSFGGQGRGISMIAGGHALEHAILHPGKNEELARAVIQRYIPDPLFLARQGHSKHTLRVYTLISSVSPLQVWIHTEGLAKFAATPFSSGLEAFVPKFRDMHITNNPTSETAAGYRNPETEQKGSLRWSLSAWKREIDRIAENGEDAGKCPGSRQIWAQICDAMVKSVMAGLPRLREASHEADQKKRTTTRRCGDDVVVRRFQLFGSDVEMDSTYRPWLIEHNVNPMLENQGVYERPDKLALVREVFDLVGVANHTAVIDPLHTLTGPVIRSHCPALVPLVDQLGSDRAVEVLSEHERSVQASKRGGFQLLFPSLDEVLQATYESYVKSPSAEDRLLWAWKKCVAAKGQEDTS
jgi:Tubulin-tyrosine ligase family